MASNGSLLPKNDSNGSDESPKNFRNILSGSQSGDENGSPGFIVWHGKSSSSQKSYCDSEAAAADDDDEFEDAFEKVRSYWRLRDSAYILGRQILTLDQLQRIATVLTIATAYSREQESEKQLKAQLSINNIGYHWTAKCYLK